MGKTKSIVIRFISIMYRLLDSIQYGTRSIVFGTGLLYFIAVNFKVSNDILEDFYPFTFSNIMLAIVTFSVPIGFLMIIGECQKIIFKWLRIAICLLILSAAGQERFPLLIIGVCVLTPISIKLLDIIGNYLDYSFANETRLILISPIGKATMKMNSTQSSSIPIARKTAIQTDLRRTAVHEAGHALVAYLLGYDVMQIEINHLRGHVQHGRFEYEYGNEIMICYAGIYAERLFFKNKQYLNRGSEEDIKTATRLIYQYNNILGGKHLLNTQVLSRIKRGFVDKTWDDCVSMAHTLQNRTDSLLRANEQLLIELSDYIYQKKKVSAEEWKFFIDKAILTRSLGKESGVTLDADV